MKMPKDKQVALLCIRNLNRYLEGEIEKEEWKESLCRIQDMIGQQQVLPFHLKNGKDLQWLETTSDNEIAKRVPAGYA